jgi:hypothetical protein
MARVLDLYDHPSADGRVICVDEFGPLNLQPRPGRGWFPAKRPTRLRATFNRTGGIRHMFAALDLATGHVPPIPRPQTLHRVPRLPQATPGPVPGRKAVRRVRQLQPAQEDRGRHLVPGPRHRVGVHPEQRILAELDRVRVHRPAVLRPRRQRLPSHTAQENAIAGYVRWRNKHVQPKRQFAIDSKIRRPD